LLLKVLNVINHVFNLNENTFRLYCLKLCTAKLKFQMYPFSSYAIWVWEPWGTELY